MSEDSIKNLDKDGQKALQEEIAKLRQKNEIPKESEVTNNKTLISTPNPETEEKTK